ncbi:DUF427 domain-containing protein [Nannocystaceae bacterium ST9]
MDRQRTNLDHSVAARRPPRIIPSQHRIRVLFDQRTIADTTRALRVSETRSPRTWYIPAEDVRLELLEPSSGTIWCEYKGLARFYDIVVPGRISTSAAWTYPQPRTGYGVLRNHFCFMASRVDEAWVDDRRAHDEPEGLAGGWITREVLELS